MQRFRVKRFDSQGFDSIRPQIQENVLMTSCVFILSAIYHSLIDFSLNNFH